MSEDDKKNQHPMATLLKKIPQSQIRKNQEIEAKIVSLSKKGVYFDLGSKAYGVLGREELQEISTYLPYLKKGDKIMVKIITPEAKDGNPVVSLKKFFYKGKWEILKQKKEKEEEIEVVCGDYGKGGVFVDFMGIRGVIPKIQLTEEYLNNPNKLAGQKIKVKVLEADEKKNRLVVSQKAAALKISQEELKKRFDKIIEGKKYQAKVLGVSEFGAFCEVDGIEGLIHISELSWEKVTNPSLYLKPNEIVEVMVVEKNPQTLKLNLSLKRLTPDPWEKIEEKYPKDKEIEGEVVRKEKYGYFVRFESGVEGLIHSSKTNKKELKIGEKIKVYIEKINKKNRRISLLLPQKEKPVTYR
ncbi:MAG: S1 RNA-binding domain-containing protein [Patescibacteria group bacterium]|nr:S1 RNA-binding domain-containing protein [Patescibacteria group bacterium]